jgi:hypothetical protein
MELPARDQHPSLFGPFTRRKKANQASEGDASSTMFLLSKQKSNMEQRFFSPSAWANPIKLFTVVIYKFL